MKINSILRVARSYKFLVPEKFRIKVIRKHQKLVFRSAIKQFDRLITKKMPDEELLNRLVYGWGNQGYSAKNTYIKAIIREAIVTNGPILECGSGLSTILLGLIAKKRGLKLYSLENDFHWGEKVIKIIKKLKIDQVELYVNPLVSYGNYYWYDPPLNSLPDNFPLVICDGPPGKTQGGRYGLLPIMKEKLRMSRILLDDYSRKEEKEIVEQWKNIYGIDVLNSQDDASYAIIMVDKVI